MMTIVTKNSLFQVHARQCSAHREEWYTGSVLVLCSGGALFDSREDTDYPDREFSQASSVHPGK